MALTLGQLKLKPSQDGSLLVRPFNSCAQQQTLTVEHSTSSLKNEHVIDTEFLRRASRGRAYRGRDLYCRVLSGPARRSRA